MEYEIANSSDESGPDLNHRTSAESNNRKIYDSEDDKHHNKINSNCEGYDTFSIKAAPSESNVNLSPFRSKYRFFVLALFCMLMFGGYFCMDQPNALSSYINDEMTGGSSFKYNMLYSMYSYPNIILPFFSGVMIDKLGLKTSLNILFGLCIIGQSLFVLGGYIGDTTGLIFALIGRTFFGIGNESLSIVQSLFANLWFKGRELAFALAMGLSIGRLGSTSNNLLMPIIAENSSLGTALLFGLSLVFFSYWVGLALLYMEGKARRDENYVEPQNQNEINCSYIKKFPLCFWIITINCVTIYSCIFPFANISNDFFISKYGFSLKQASKCTSTVFIIAAFSCSIFGIVSDKIGKRVTFIILASLLLLVSHVLFLTLASCVQCYEGLIPMIMIGVSYSIYGAALWPTIPIVVKEEYLGTAFGVTIAIQNAGLAFGPNIIGLIQIFFEGYSLVSIFFIVVSIIGLMSGMLLYYVNMRDHNNILQKPTKEIYQEENSD